MAGGGKRAGAGRRKGNVNVVGGRARMRTAVDDEDRWTRFIATVDAQLAKGNPDPFLKAFEHGYGRPPQALDVSHRTQDGPLEFRILDATGADFAFGGGDLPTRSVPLPTAVAE